MAKRILIVLLSLIGAASAKSGGALRSRPWGSRYAAAHLGGAPVVAMIDLDMAGLPIRANAPGDASPGAFRRTPAGTEKLFTTFGLEHRMQAIGCWPFR